MSTLLRRHANSGAFAGFGLLSIVTSVLLALGLAGAGATGAVHASPTLQPVLQGLLGTIRVGG